MSTWYYDNVARIWNDDGKEADLGRYLAEVKWEQREPYDVYCANYFNPQRTPTPLAWVVTVTTRHVDQQFLKDMAAVLEVIEPSGTVLKIQTD